MKVDAAAEAIEQSFKDTYSKAEIEVKLEDKTYKLGVADSLDMDAKKAVLSFHKAIKRINKLL